MAIYYSCQYIVSIEVRVYYTIHDVQKPVSDVQHSICLQYLCLYSPWPFDEFFFYRIIVGASINIDGYCPNRKLWTF